MTITIPEKLYFKIGEVAKMADVPTHVLRYWETEFPGIKPKRASSKQRLFRRQDVELILTIKTLLHEQGYTIAGAKKFLKVNKDGPLPQKGNSTKVDAAQRLRSIKKELMHLQSLLKAQK